VDLLTKQIRMTGRAFPLFDIAQLILAKPERHTVTISVKRKPDGTPVQPLFLCALDETLWLSDDDAVRHVLERHFTTFYQAERIKIDPPKGVYTFVAQCGMSGVVLGPPNYHDYQNQLRKLHAERFPRMPFDAFKARVKIVKDEEVVKKWIEDQSWRTEYVCLNLPEPLRLSSREEVEKHFRQVHLPDIIKPVETHRLAGPASRDLRDRTLLRWIRLRWEDQKRFPLQLATVLSQQFATRGLQFFKVNKTVTHVSVARPHFLDLEATPVSDGVRRIVEFINATPKGTPRHLLQALAPCPPAPAASTPAAAPAPAASSPEASASTAPAAPAAAAASATPATPATPVVTTPEMAAVLTDLHWLIHQGHVIEFANGVLETAKKPVVKPPPPPRPAAPAPAPAPPSEAAASTVPATAAETSALLTGGPEAAAILPPADPAVTNPEPFGEAVAPEAPASSGGPEHAPPV
jgi:hypothetical protein